jgi:hormone-sensitive lipase
MSSDKGETSKKKLSASSTSESQDPLTLFDTLLELCNNNIQYFVADETESGSRIHGAFVGLVDHINVARPLVEQINAFAAEYDYDEKTPGNGFRGFVFVVFACLRRTIRLAKDIIGSRNTILFRKSTYVK